MQRANIFHYTYYFEKCIAVVIGEDLPATVHSIHNITYKQRYLPKEKPDYLFEIMVTLDNETGKVPLYEVNVQTPLETILRVKQASIAILSINPEKDNYFARLQSYYKSVAPYFHKEYGRIIVALTAGTDPAITGDLEIFCNNHFEHKFKIIICNGMNALGRNIQATLKSLYITPEIRQIFFKRSYTYKLDLNLLTPEICLAAVEESKRKYYDRHAIIPDGLLKLILFCFLPNKFGKAITNPDCCRSLLKLLKHNCNGEFALNSFKHILLSQLFNITIKQGQENELINDVIAKLESSRQLNDPKILLFSLWVKPQMPTDVIKHIQHTFIRAAKVKM